jgi:hypothetical protein
MISNKEYSRITRCWGDFKFPNFTIEETQQLLNTWGYDVIIHKGMCTTYEYTNFGGEHNKTGRTFQEERERILAIKRGVKQKLPERIDSEEADLMDFQNVFNTELKSRIIKIFS